MSEEAEWLPCAKAPKRRGEAIRQTLNERKLLRTDARIISDATSIYLPLVRALTDAELEEFGVLELTATTREFTILERRESIEDIIGFKPSYEVVGDIAVLTEAMPAEEEAHVADALMSLHRHIKVVAKRISAVEGVYRTRRLAVIAGEQRTETMHTENACRFKLDLETVYFNPRLAGERNRVALQTAQSEKAEEIIDIFAGVGPFAIQIAKRAPQSHVTAIDINPNAKRYLTENIALNHVQNVDAVVGDIRELHTQFRDTADRIIMNLPKSAYLFLREALSMLKPRGGIIHFYDLESAYPADDLGKHEVIEIAMTEAKEKLLSAIQDLSDEFPGYSVEIRDTRKVKAYAPYAYIIGIDVAICGL
jgi:tRNA (guanine37-N1)-methyltransferase